MLCPSNYRAVADCVSMLTCRAVPSAVFSQPPIGQVGLTEEQVRTFSLNICRKFAKYTHIYFEGGLQFRQPKNMGTLMYSRQTSDPLKPLCQVCLIGYSWRSLYVQIRIELLGCTCVETMRPRLCRFPRNFTLFITLSVPWRLLCGINCPFYAFL